MSPNIACSFAGNSDMYGLGIRIGFYLQWFGEILASWIALEEVPGIRLSNSFFIGATFLALILQTSEDNLRPAEIYIILLLTFGGYLYFVPLYLWRIVTGFRAELDPSRWPRVLNGRVFSALNHGMLVGVAIFQIWFWIKKVKDVGKDGCEEFGFFFTKLRLNETGFVVVNLLFYFFLVFCCLGSLCVLIAKALKIIPEKEYEEILESKALSLQQVQAAVNVIIASTVVIATELTIRWNHFESISDVSSAGQLIPLVIGIGLVMRVLYVGMCGSVEKKDNKHSGDSQNPGPGSEPKSRRCLSLDDWPTYGAFKRRLLTAYIRPVPPEYFPEIGVAAPLPIEVKREEPDIRLRAEGVKAVPLEDLENKLEGKTVVERKRSFGERSTPILNVPSPSANPLERHKAKNKRDVSAEIEVLEAERDAVRVERGVGRRDGLSYENVFVNGHSKVIMASAPERFSSNFWSNHQME